MENFIVSARKYRPATFASVVGQSHITSTLKNAIERGQLAHAYLFCGPRGVGKTTCARIFAKTINCLSPKGNEACGECESCVGFEQSRSMNIHELDAASNNSVEDIRSLIEQVRIIPQVGRYSLFIIDEVHMLSTAAFNAFLKTLEEPPAHAIFILATTERHKILPTILSRCQCYDFNRIRVEDGAEYLRYIADCEGVTVDDESLNLIAQKADGGMRDALSMFDKAVSFGGVELDYRTVAQSLGVVDYETFFRITDQLLKGEYHSALITFDEVLGMGFGVGSFLTGLARHMRNLLVARDRSTIRLMELTESMTGRYEQQAARCSVEFIFAAINILTAIDGDLKRSSNQRLLVELGLMKISTLGKKKIVEESHSGSFENVPLPTLTQGAERATEKTEPEVQRASQQDSESLRTSQQDSEILSKTQKFSEAPKAPQTAHQAAPQAAKAPVPAKKRTALFSLTSALESTKSGEEQQTEQASEERRYDPKAQEKIESVRGDIIEYLEGCRPRFVQIFKEMQIEGSVIRIKVPSDELRLEVLRNDTELLSFIVERGAIDGVVEIDVEVQSVVEVKKIIKLEDRISHFTQLNPVLLELTDMLDMQVDG